MRTIPTVCALAVVVGALAQTPDSLWKAPPEAGPRRNPIAGSDAIAGGRKLFLRHCTECHGENGAAGRKRAANLSSAATQQQLDGDLFWKITNGKSDGNMTSFSRLPELQRWQLVLYIRELRASKPEGP